MILSRVAAASVPTPAVGQVELFTDSSGNLNQMDSTRTVTAVAASNSSVSAGSNIIDLGSSTDAVIYNLDMGTS